MQKMDTRRYSNWNFCEVYKIMVSHTKHKPKNHLRNGLNNNEGCGGRLCIKNMLSATQKGDNISNMTESVM